MIKKGAATVFPRGNSRLDKLDRFVILFFLLCEQSPEILKGPPINVFIF